MKSKITLCGPGDSGKTNLLRCLIYVLTSNPKSKVIAPKSLTELFHKVQDMRVGVNYYFNGHYTMLAVSTIGDNKADVDKNWAFFDCNPVRMKIGGFYNLDETPILCISPCRNTGDSLEAELVNCKVRLKEIELISWISQTDNSHLLLPTVTVQELNEFEAARVFCSKLTDGQKITNIAKAKYIKQQIETSIANIKL